MHWRFIECIKGYRMSEIILQRCQCLFKVERVMGECSKTKASLNKPKNFALTSSIPNDHSEGHQ